MANNQNLLKGNRFSKDNQPKRNGREKQNRTLLLEALRAVRMKEKQQVQDPDTGEMVEVEVDVQLTEEIFIQRAIQMALVDGGMMRDVLCRLIPHAKPTAPLFKFELKGVTPSERITEIEDLVADGELPIDAAETMVKIIRHGAEVFEMSEMVKRLESLEAKLNGEEPQG